MPYAKSIRWAAITFPKGARPWASLGVPGVVDFVGGILEENLLKQKMLNAEIHKVDSRRFLQSGKFDNSSEHIW